MCVFVSSYYNSEMSLCLVEMGGVQNVLWDIRALSARHLVNWLLASAGVDLCKTPHFF